MIVSLDSLCIHIKEEDAQIITDSRQVKAGDVFVVLPLAIASHLEKKYPSVAYITAAIQQKASYIVLEKELYALLEKEEQVNNQEIGNDVHYVLVDDARVSIGILAQAKYNTKNLPFPIIALTGTNGKTTSSYLLEHLYTSCNKKVAVLGTVSYHWDGHYEEAPLTTPACLYIHKALAEMRKANIDVAIMEISSHALDQNRIAGLEFAGALFTNLTQDHLDYHENMENYYQAKLSLFTNAPRTDKAMSVFGSDPFGKRILEACPQANAFILHKKGHAECTELCSSNTILHAQLLENTPEGLLIEHIYNGQKWTLQTNLVGEHNACNILGIECLALQLGFDIEELQHLADFKGIPGRLERITAPKGQKKENVSFFVDYAHTPDALFHAQDALRQAGFSRIITVFGCGGDRDKTKRPLMGEAVAKESDIVILTSDNPRTENPEQILDDIMPGLKNAHKVYRITDRREALKLAVQISQDGDAVLVAGKGHEMYQIIGTEKIYFSDQKFITEFLSEL